jgi:hypothetical protein
MTVREIQAFLAEMDAVEVSPDFMSTSHRCGPRGSDGVAAAPLEPTYPVVFFDARASRSAMTRTVRSKAVYLALASCPTGVATSWASGSSRPRRKVLDEGFHRLEDARLPGHPDGRHRRPQGHERGTGRDLSGDDAADMHRPSVRPEPRRHHGRSARLASPPRSTAPASPPALDAFRAGPWGRRFPTVVASWRRAWAQ